MAHTRKKRKICNHSPSCRKPLAYSTRQRHYTYADPQKILPSESLSSSSTQNTNQTTNRTERTSNSDGSSATDSIGSQDSSSISNHTGDVISDVISNDTHTSRSETGSNRTSDSEDDEQVSIGEASEGARYMGQVADDAELWRIRKCIYMP